MKQHSIAAVIFLATLCTAMSGCGEAGNAGNSETSASENATAAAVSDTEINEEIEESEGAANAGQLYVRFGSGSQTFVMRLESNSTAQTIAEYVGSSSWNLPIYSFDESDVMEYYDIPSRYDIPDNSAAVTQAHAGDVFYSDPNRIVLYYADAEINEEYTLIGTFDATEEFVEAVVNNPVLDGWGNQIVSISAEE